MIASFLFDQFPGNFFCSYLTLTDCFDFSNEFKRDGAGRRNWGAPGDEIAP